ERRRRLGDAALLVRERDHAPHRRSLGGFGPVSRSRKQACEPHRAPFFALMLAIPPQRTGDFRGLGPGLSMPWNVRRRQDEPQLTSRVSAVASAATTTTRARGARAAIATAPAATPASRASRTSSLSPPT